MSIENQKKFDVFLSHNGIEKDLAISLGSCLRARGLHVWLDAWELRPGLSWQQGIIEGLDNSLACAVLIGKSGYGGWHKREMEVALNKQGTEYPVIPVLLPGAPERMDIGSFLELLTWVDLRSAIDDQEGISRLIWGITGLRPEEASQVDSVNVGDSSLTLDNNSKRFRIENPKNGDLLFGPSLFSGAGPSNSSVSLHYRAPGAKNFVPGSTAETDSEGSWSTLGPHTSHLGDLNPGPYEVYAAGVQDSGVSQPITIYYKDVASRARVTRLVGKKAFAIEISYRLASGFIEGTKLQERRLIHSDKIKGLVDEIESLAQEVGSRLSNILLGYVPRDQLEVEVRIDDTGRVSLSPSTAWATYYSFPTPRGPGEQPSSNLRNLWALQISQQAWRIYPRIGKIPLEPFGKHFAAESCYLEIRHEGYRPEFLSLEDTAEANTYRVALLPVINKRIAVIGFPAIDSDVSIGNFSQLIVEGIVSALESVPQLATFGYFSDQPANAFPPAVAIGNEILTLFDVNAIQEQLDSVNTFMVSGEGRHLQRKELDINYIIRGNYRGLRS